MSPEEYVIEAFTCGDCWALALELKSRFPHLTVCTLIDPFWAGDDESYDHMHWEHAVVLDKNTDTFYDVTGAHRQEDNFPDWEIFDWEDIYEIPDEDITDYFSGQTRLYPEVSLDEGVRLATVDMPAMTAVV